MHHERVYMIMELCQARNGGRGGGGRACGREVRAPMGGSGLGVQPLRAATRLRKWFALFRQGGELFDRIAECGGLPEDEARRYFVHIVSALHHCHQNHVYHRDLKPENILLDGQVRATHHHTPSQRNSTSPDPSLTLHAAPRTSNPTFLPPLPPAHN